MVYGSFIVFTYLLAPGIDPNKLVDLPMLVRIYFGEKKINEWNADKRSERSLTTDECIRFVMA